MGYKYQSIFSKYLAGRPIQTVQRVIDQLAGPMGGRQMADAKEQAILDEMLLDPDVRKAVKDNDFFGEVDQLMSGSQAGLGQATSFPPAAIEAARASPFMTDAQRALRVAKQSPVRLDAQRARQVVQEHRQGYAPTDPGLGPRISTGRETIMNQRQAFTDQEKADYVTAQAGQLVSAIAQAYGAGASASRPVYNSASGYWEVSLSLHGNEVERFRFDAAYSGHRNGAANFSLRLEGMPLPQHGRPGGGYDVTVGRAAEVMKTAVQRYGHRDDASEKISSALRTVFLGQAYTSAADRQQSPLAQAYAQSSGFRPANFNVTRTDVRGVTTSQRVDVAANNIFAAAKQSGALGFGRKQAPGANDIFEKNETGSNFMDYHGVVGLSLGGVPLKDGRVLTGIAKRPYEGAEPQVEAKRLSAIGSMHRLGYVSDMQTGVANWSRTMYDQQGNATVYKNETPTQLGRVTYTNVLPNGSGYLLGRGRTMVQAFNVDNIEYQGPLSWKYGDEGHTRLERGPRGGYVIGASVGPDGKEVLHELPTSDAMGVHSLKVEASNGTFYARGALEYDPADSMVKSYWANKFTLQQADSAEAVGFSGVKSGTDIIEPFTKKELIPSKIMAHANGVLLRLQGMSEYQRRSFLNQVRQIKFNDPAYGMSDEDVAGIADNLGQAARDPGATFNIGLKEFKLMTRLYMNEVLPTLRYGEFDASRVDDSVKEAFAGLPQAGNGRVKAVMMDESTEVGLSILHSSNNPGRTISGFEMGLAGLTGRLTEKEMEARRHAGVAQANLDIVRAHMATGGGDVSNPTNTISVDDINVREIQEYLKANNLSEANDADFIQALQAKYSDKMIKLDYFTLERGAETGTGMGGLRDVELNRVDQTAYLLAPKTMAEISKTSQPGEVTGMAAQYVRALKGALYGGGQNANWSAQKYAEKLREAAPAAIHGAFGGVDADLFSVISPSLYNRPEDVIVGDRGLKSMQARGGDIAQLKGYPTTSDRQAVMAVNLLSSASDRARTMSIRYGKTVGVNPVAAAMMNRDYDGDMMQLAKLMDAGQLKAETANNAIEWILANDFRSRMLGTIDTRNLTQNEAIKSLQGKDIRALDIGSMASPNMDAIRAILWHSTVPDNELAKWRDDMVDEQVSTIEGVRKLMGTVEEEILRFNENDPTSDAANKRVFALSREGTSRGLQKFAMLKGQASTFNEFILQSRLLSKDDEDFRLANLMGERVYMKAQDTKTPFSNDLARYWDMTRSLRLTGGKSGGELTLGFTRNSLAQGDSPDRVFGSYLNSSKNEELGVGSGLFGFVEDVVKTFAGDGADNEFGKLDMADRLGYLTKDPAVREALAKAHAAGESTGKLAEILMGGKTTSVAAVRELMYGGQAGLGFRMLGQGALLRSNNVRTDLEGAEGDADLQAKRYNAGKGLANFFGLSWKPEDIKATTAAMTEKVKAAKEVDLVRKLLGRRPDLETADIEKAMAARMEMMGDTLEDVWDRLQGPSYSDGSGNGEFPVRVNHEMEQQLEFRRHVLGQSGQTRTVSMNANEAAYLRRNPNAPRTDFLKFVPGGSGPSYAESIHPSGLGKQNVLDILARRVGETHGVWGGDIEESTLGTLAHYLMEGSIGPNDISEAGLNYSVNAGNREFNVSGRLDLLQSQGGGQFGLRDFKFLKGFTGGGDAAAEHIRKKYMGQAAAYYYGLQNSSNATLGGAPRSDRVKGITGTQFLVANEAMYGKQQELFAALRSMEQAGKVKLGGIRGNAAGFMEDAIKQNPALQAIVDDIRGMGIEGGFHKIDISNEEIEKYIQGGQMAADMADYTGTSQMADAAWEAAKQAFGGEDKLVEAIRNSGDIGAVMNQFIAPARASHNSAGAGTTYSGDPGAKARTADVFDAGENIQEPAEFQGTWEAAKQASAGASTGGSIPTGGGGGIPTRLFDVLERLTNSMDAGRPQSGWRKLGEINPKTNQQHGTPVIQALRKALLEGDRSALKSIPSETMRRMVAPQQQAIQALAKGGGLKSPHIKALTGLITNLAGDDMWELNAAVETLGEGKKPLGEMWSGESDPNLAEAMGDIPSLVQSLNGRLDEIETKTAEIRSLGKAGATPENIKSLRTMDAGKSKIRTAIKSLTRSGESIRTTGALGTTDRAELLKHRELVEEFDAYGVEKTSAQIAKENVENLPPEIREALQGQVEQLRAAGVGASPAERKALDSKQRKLEGILRGGRGAEHFTGDFNKLAEMYNASPSTDARGEASREVLAKIDAWASPAGGGGGGKKIPELLGLDEKFAKAVTDAGAAIKGFHNETNALRESLAKGEVSPDQFARKMGDIDRRADPYRRFLAQAPSAQAQADMWDQQAQNYRGQAAAATDDKERERLTGLAGAAETMRDEAYQDPIRNVEKAQAERKAGLKGWAKRFVEEGAVQPIMQLFYATGTSRMFFDPAQQAMQMAGKQDEQLRGMMSRTGLGAGMGEFERMGNLTQMAQLAEARNTARIWQPLSTNWSRMMSDSGLGTLADGIAKPALGAGLMGSWLGGGMINSLAQMKDAGGISGSLGGFADKNKLGLMGLATFLPMAGALAGSAVGSYQGLTSMKAESGVDFLKTAQTTGLAGMAAKGAWNTAGALINNLGSFAGNVLSGQDVNAAGRAYFAESIVGTGEKELKGMQLGYKIQQAAVGGMTSESMTGLTAAEKRQAFQLAYEGVKSADDQTFMGIKVAPGTKGVAGLADQYTIEEASRLFQIQQAAGGSKTIQDIASQYGSGVQNSVDYMSTARQMAQTFGGKTANWLGQLGGIQTEEQAFALQRGMQWGQAQVMLGGTADMGSMLSFGNLGMREQQQALSGANRLAGVSQDAMNRGIALPKEMADALKGFNDGLNKTVAEMGRIAGTDKGIESADYAKQQEILQSQLRAGGALATEAEQFGGVRQQYQALGQKVPGGFDAEFAKAVDKFAKAVESGDEEGQQSARGAMRGITRRADFGLGNFGKVSNFLANAGIDATALYGEDAATLFQGATGAMGAQMLTGFGSNPYATAMGAQQLASAGSISVGSAAYRGMSGMDMTTGLRMGQFSFGSKAAGGGWAVRPDSFLGAAFGSYSNAQKQLGAMGMSQGPGGDFGYVNAASGQMEYGMEGFQLASMAQNYQNQMASIGISAANAQRSLAMWSGKGVSRYTNMYAGQELPWEPGKVGQAFQEGRGTLQIQNDMERLQRQQQKDDLERSQKNRDLQVRQFMEKWDFNRGQLDKQWGWQQEDFGFRQKQMSQQRAWTQQDWAFGRQQSERQFGYQVEDINEEMRFATGRQRRQLEKQLKRAGVEHETGVSREDEMQKRQKQLWSDEDKRFDTEKKRAADTHKTKIAEMDMEKRHFLERQALDDDALAKQKKALEERWKLEDELKQLQDSQTKANMEASIAAAGVAAKSAKDQYDTALRQQAIESQMAKDRAAAELETFLRWYEFLGVLGGKVFEMMQMITLQKMAWQGLQRSDLADQGLGGERRQGGAIGDGAEGDDIVPHAAGYSGIVNSPTQMLVGEAGAEYVQVRPLGLPGFDAAAGAGNSGGGAGTVIVNLTLDGKVLAQETVNVLGPALYQQRRR